MFNIKLRLLRLVTLALLACPALPATVALLACAARPVYAGLPALPGLHRHHPKADTHKGPAMVVAANPLAVDAGMEILKKGGKAIDAAVAIQAMLGLVEPQSSGVGGGAFLMYYEASSGVVTAIDGRETAPAGATPDMFLDDHGKPLPFVEAVRSGRSTGVPGAIAMLSAAHARLGVRPWKELFQPAIRAATQGFKVPERLASFLGEGSPFPPTTEIRALFSKPNGEPLNAGDTSRIPEYAKTLGRIADEGPRALYEGSIAAEIVKVTQSQPLAGTMTLKDMAAYRSNWADPLCRPYRQYTVCVPRPPSSGVTLLEMLGILENTDIAERGPNDPQAWFLFAQASRLMYADRDHYVDDPAFTSRCRPSDCSTRRISACEPNSSARRRGPRRRPATSSAPPAWQRRDPRIRRHESLRRGRCRRQRGVHDHDGRVGVRLQPHRRRLRPQQPTHGLLSCAERRDRSSRGERVQGGKKPRSSMSPVIVLDHEGQFVAALGSPGGSAILDYNAKAFVALVGLEDVDQGGDRVAQPDRPRRRLRRRAGSPSSRRVVRPARDEASSFAPAAPKIQASTP